MRIIKISALMAMFFLLSCEKPESIYPPSDNNNNDDDSVLVDKDIVEADQDTVGSDIDLSDENDNDDDIPDIHDVDENEPDADPADNDPGDHDLTPDVDNHIPFGCGNGIKELGEECDNGEFNNNLPGEIGLTCRTNCKFARCGDEIIDTSEICDDGNALSGDYCDSTCTASNGKCGDGIVQLNEDCDKALSGQGIGSYCSDDCMDIIGSCGDGLIQIDIEICDKSEIGDGIGPFYCAADCKTVIGACGDTTLQANETCDDGENNGRYNYCNETCNGKAFHCGDGIKDYGYEECDDGNDAENDYCTNDCMTELGRCGDGAIQGNEACDNAVFGAGTGDYCSTDCKNLLGYCGDEIVQSNEQCDRGDLNGSPYCEYGVEGSCDKCNSVCNLVPGESTFCGDGKVDTSNGETCDKAEFGSGTGGYCAFDCKSSNGYCGDGGVQSNEACDKAIFGDGTGPEYCSNDCKNIIGYCGDGIQQTVEQCDNGANNTDKCAYGLASCTVCNSECKNVAGTISVCGDSRTDVGNGELCDSGANNGQYRSSYPGHCNSDCHGTGAGGYCGDENIQSSNEQCDKGSDNGKLDCIYGHTSCEVCTSTCTNAPGTVKYCGDSVVSNGEICDSGENNGIYGYCKSDCTGFGERCGDGITNGTESCDDGVLNGNYGKCASDCSGPGKRCGDGIKQIEEICDDG
ncbi:MAG TPA: hypothetical protein PLZ43_15025, partial [bacterium]|nr:hypothetical protein [bacterium]